MEIMSTLEPHRAIIASGGPRVPAASRKDVIQANTAAGELHRRPAFNIIRAPDVLTLGIMSTYIPARGLQHPV